MPTTAPIDALIGRTTCTVEESAEILGISRKLAYQAAATGEIPTLRIGRRLLVPVPKLIAMLGGDTAA